MGRCLCLLLLVVASLATPIADQATQQLSAPMKKVTPTKVRSGSLPMSASPLDNGDGVQMKKEAKYPKVTKVLGAPNSEAKNVSSENKPSVAQLPVKESANASATTLVKQDTDSSSLPSVSLCVPCIPRDIGQPIETLLHSTQSQTHKPKEVVIAVSEISSDDAQALETHLRASYPDLPAITVLGTTDKQTPGENRNRAAAASSADLVSFVDADDEMHPQRLEIAASIIKERDVKVVLNSFLINPGKIDTALHTQYDWRAETFVTGTSIAQTTQDQYGFPITEPNNLLGLFVTSGGSEVLLAQGHSTCRRDVWEEVKFGSDLRGEDCMFLRGVFGKFGVSDNTMAATGIPLTFYHPSSAPENEYLDVYRSLLQKMFVVMRPHLAL